MNKLQLTSILVISFGLIACVSNPTKKIQSKPDWIVNEPATAGHVYGVGSAPVYVDEAKAIQQAQDAARVTMIQKLKVTIKGNFSQDTQEIRQTGKQTQLVKTVRNQISSSIPQAEIDNLEIIENYVDVVGKVAYSLVHLDRINASSKLRQRILALDQQVIDLSNSISNDQTTLKQLQSISPALGLLEQRSRLAEQLQLIHMNNRTEYKGDELKVVEVRIQGLFDGLKVSLTASNNAGSEIRSGLAESLTKLGLRVSRGTGDLNFFFKADLREVEKGGRFFVFADGQVQIKDNNGRVLSEFSQNSKGVSGASIEQAKYKAVQSLGKKLGNELAKSLIQKID
ncbi:MAG: hypothetical protein ACJA0E_000092 [Bermanella sp.]|jgi:hypothetical protein